MPEVDLVNRDPHQINGSYLQLEYDDVLGENEGIQSMDCVWRNSFKCFTCGKNFCYKLNTFCCGICTALSWGCTFGSVVYFLIWLVTPFMRLLHITLHPTKKIISIMNSTFFGPCYETMGLMFARCAINNSGGQID